MNNLKLIKLRNIHETMATDSVRRLVMWERMGNKEDK